MKINKKLAAVNLIFLFAFFISGCASIAKLAVGKDDVKIPQIVAHLEPSLAQNRITVSGKVVIQNPTPSALSLDKIYLEILGEDKRVLGRTILDWENPHVMPKQESEAPVTIRLGLSALNNKNVAVFIRTGFTYQRFGWYIPIESRVAVLHLEALKEIIARPLYVNILTKLRSTIFGNSSIDFVVGITNPLSIDLSLEQGIIAVSTQAGEIIAKTRITETFFRGSESNQIKGSVGVGNIWGKLIRGEALKGRPLKLQLSGNMRIPETDIVIPFQIESAVEIKLSFI